ncbi:MAG TPA: cytidine deaminase [Kiritimatiellia bacterium]|nr:cytidine deaminase [Kiritimatiellia bacterium]
MNAHGIDPLPLLRAAVATAARAHAPYSKFYVGAALLTHDGEVITGCNVENASYGLTNCAERTAIFTAVARGITSFRAVAVVASGAMPWPCGACRQVLSEFCPPETPVFIAPADRLDQVQTLTLGDLLPHQFKLLKP